MIWNGIDVDVWGPAQTRKPKPKRATGAGWYSGLDEISGFDWWDYLDPIPLDIRYASFKRRIDKALNK